jgi:AraC-like DNA-binding protein
MSLIRASLFVLNHIAKRQEQNMGLNRFYTELKSNLAFSNAHERKKWADVITQNSDDNVSFRENLPSSKFQILKSLQKLIDQKAFTNSKCNLAFLAHKVGTNSNYLTKVIKWHYGVSFSEFLHNTRLKEVLSGLHSDKKYRMYGVDSLAREFGYTGKRTFEMAFKSKIGVSPGHYIKNLSNVIDINDFNEGNASSIALFS